MRIQTQRKGAKTQRGKPQPKKKKKGTPPVVDNIGRMQTQPVTHGSVPNSFIHKHSASIIGVLSGFDRLRLRGTLRQLYGPQVMEAYLNACHILIKDFGQLVERTTLAIKEKARALAAQAGRPFLFVPSSQTSKEELVRRIAAKDQVTEGLIAILNAVEPCQSFRVVGNRQTKMIELKVETRKCSHLYFYFEHARFGFMHLRLQTWFPFQVNICLNGRHWLARQLDQAGVAYQKKENTFLRVADLGRAQALLDQQLEMDWPKELGQLLRQVHPLGRQICRPLDLEYYWSASETEYATDVIFKDADSLARLYPSWVHHAMSSFSSPDVMRFLGRYVPVSTGKVWGQFEGEIISDSKRRTEGVRVKHSVNGNSIKFYDKQGSVLRVETTIVRPEEFRTYRKPEGRPKETKRWLPLRRGLADLPRRADISHRSNERYLQALAAVSGTVPLFEWVQKTCQPVTKAGQRYRALNPWAPEDGRLLELINQGEFAINGFRNRDMRAAYFKSRATEQESKRRTGWMGRRLRLLRAHGLIQKVSGTHRYIVTPKGRMTTTALLAARKADVEQLTKMAA
jgi:hypothetical protein